MCCSYKTMEENEVYGDMNQLELFGDYKLKVGHWTITTFYDKRRKQWRLMIDNRETFYNDKRELREWETEEEAIEFVEAVYPESAKVRFNNN